MGGASVNRCVNSSGGVPHRLFFYAYPIGILGSLVYVSQEIRSIETTGGAWPHRVRRRTAAKGDSIGKDTIFNAMSQARCLLGGGRGAIGRGPRRVGNTYLADRGGVPGLTGEHYGQYPVPRHERACASRGAATARNRKAGRLPSSPARSRTCSNEAPTSDTASGLVCTSTHSSARDHIGLDLVDRDLGRRARVVDGWGSASRGVAWHVRVGRIRPGP